MNNKQPMQTQIDRHAAAKINPLISILNTRDTLQTIGDIVSDLGYLVSFTTQRGTDEGVANLEKSYLIFGAVAAALHYESESLYLDGKAQS